MRSLIIVLLSLFMATSTFAQRKQEPKPATPAAAPKPKGPSPYVIKKDYDSSMVKIDKKISNLQSSINAIKGGINNKDAQINNLSEQMVKVEEVLNSTNFKISLTSDSLSKTQLSLEEIQKENENRFNNLDTQISTLKSTINWLWISLIVALIIPIAIWFLLKKQLNVLNNSFILNQKNLQNLIEENHQALQKNANALEQQIRMEGRTAQSYADQLNQALKNELILQSNEIAKTSNTLVLVSNDITDLQKKLSENTNPNQQD